MGPLLIRRRWYAAFAVLFITTVLCPSPTTAQTKTKAPGPLASDAVTPDNIQQYADLAVKWMQQYLQIDTSNPPGNEMKAAEFFRGILDREGIENQVFEYRQGRGNIWARIPASSAGAHQRPLILLNHTDVVTSDPARWRVPPFSATVVDGV